MTEKNPLEINPELVSQILVGFIRDQLHKVDMQKVVVGLSGGIDSATSTYLAVRALGNENIWAINVPYKWKFCFLWRQSCWLNVSPLGLNKVCKLHESKESHNLDG